MTMNNLTPRRTYHFNYPLTRLREQPFFKLLSNQQKLAHVHTLTDTYNALVAYLDIEFGEHPVPKKTQNQYTTKFAALKLEAADKKHFEGWKKENHNDGDILYAQAIRDGWKGSQSFDQENDCFIWSMTMRDETNINYDICVTSRSDNMYEAMLLGLYKIFVMAANGKIPTEAARNNWG